jgi:hypothetical protein
MNKQHVFLAIALIIGAIVGSVVSNVIPNAQAAEGSYTHSSTSCNAEKCFTVITGEGVKARVCVMDDYVLNPNCTTLDRFPNSL